MGFTLSPFPEGSWKLMLEQSTNSIPDEASGDIAVEVNLLSGASDEVSGDIAVEVNLLSGASVGNLSLPSTATVGELRLAIEALSEQHAALMQDARLVADL